MLKRGNHSSVMEEVLLLTLHASYTPLHPWGGEMRDSPSAEGEAGLREEHG